MANAGHVVPQAQPSFLAGLWSNFKGTVSLIIKNIYAPFYSPPPVVKTPTGKTMQDAVSGGYNPGPLYIPGKFGFGGTGGIIPTTMVPINKGDKAADVSNIGSPQGPTGPFNVKLDATPGGVKPYPTPQPPIPYPKPATDTTLREQVQKGNIAPVPVPAVIPQAKVLELVVTASGNAIAEPVKEGGQIMFLANLKLGNGTFKDVTRSVKWSVVGDIGAIDSIGIFTARLGASVSEYGEGSGAVTATYSGPEGTFLGKSAIFKVYGAAGVEGDIGGQ